MSEIRFFGDIHGSVDQWCNKTFGSNQSVQIGDFGYGFLAPSYEKDVNEFFKNYPQHKFIRGNHDDPARCRKSPGYIEDGTFDEENSIYYIGGAWSIDFAGRTPGKSWWPDEEVDDDTFNKLFSDVLVKKPKIIVTHDAPSQATLPMFIDAGDSLFGGKLYSNRTNTWLTRIFENYKPEVWLYGHWHMTKTLEVEGTKFVCIGENDFIDLDTKTLNVKYNLNKFERVRYA